jgi:predicted transcriptional regulator of viral defense system
LYPFVVIPSELEIRGNKTMDGKGYSELSKDAVYLLSRSEFEKQKVITTEYAVKVLGSYRKATTMLDTLSRRNRLIQLRRGRYLVVPLKAPNQRWMPNEFVVASLWIGEIPYYIGYSSMYNYWGFTEQIPQSVTVLNTAKEWKRKIKSIRYVAMKISPQKMYGLKKIKIDEEDISISDKERTLVDFISNPMGSWGNVQAVVSEQIASIDLQKFIRYLIRFPVMSVRKRAGIMLERAGVLPKELIKLKRSIGKGNSYTVFNPFIKSRKGKISQGWKVILNG